MGVTTLVRRGRLLARQLTPPLSWVLLSSTGLCLPTQEGEANSPELRVPIEHWGCSNCHLPDDTNSHRIAQRPGPDLSMIGSRASARWLERWIGKPADLRAVPTMPRLFDDSPEDQADLQAVVQWLVSLGDPAGGEVGTEEVLIAAGRELYHQVGCVNCHGALDSPAVVFGDELFPKETPEPSVMSSFSDLSNKWHPAALSEFLRDPGVVHRDGRMPGMNLTAAESDLITSYLISKWGAAPATEARDESLHGRGREVFSERGCQGCHVVGDQEFKAVEAPSLAELSGLSGSDACLSSREWSGPRYDFPSPLLASMFSSGLVAANEASVPDTQEDLLERRIVGLNCRACHELDGSGGVPADLQIYTTSLDEQADLGDEGRFPPHLNGVGSKLTTSWFNEVLFDSGRARPYLATRMPQYGEAVTGLAEQFAHKAGVQPESDELWPEATDELVLAGRNLMGMQAGACVSCHSFRDYPAIGSPGPDMSAFASRLRYAWWEEYIRDPAAFKPGTRMPSFLNDGVSVWEQPFDGHFGRQTDAMWAYFSLGEFMPPPPGIGKKQGLVLEVEDRPRVFRTFLQGAGSRGIAVGFPVGIHYAFDARRALLTEVWEGEFIDASGAWSGRGGNSRGAEGEVVWKSSGAPTLVIGEQPGRFSSKQKRSAVADFAGYRIDADGAPIFRYSIGGVQIAEKSTPQRFPLHLRRRFELSNLEPGVEHWLLPGAALDSASVEGARDHGPQVVEDGVNWYRIVPDSPTCTVILEVAL